MAADYSPGSMFFRIWWGSVEELLPNCKCATCHGRVHHALPLRAAVAQYFRQLSPIIRAFLITDFTPPVGCTIGDEEPVSCGPVQYALLSSTSYHLKPPTLTIRC
jgi:hypothetical protein